MHNIHAFVVLLSERVAAVVVLVVLVPFVELPLAVEFPVALAEAFAEAFAVAFLAVAAFTFYSQIGCCSLFLILGLQVATVPFSGCPPSLNTSCIWSPPP